MQDSKTAMVTAIRRIAAITGVNHNGIHVTVLEMGENCEEWGFGVKKLLPIACTCTSDVFDEYLKDPSWAKLYNYLKYKNIAYVIKIKINV